MRAREKRCGSAMVELCPITQRSIQRSKKEIQKGTLKKFKKQNSREGGKKDLVESAKRNYLLRGCP